MSEVGALIIVGSFQGLGVIRSLRRRGIPTCVIDWCHCICRFSKYTDRFVRCPPPTEEEGFLDFLKTLATEGGLKGWVVYPNDDRTVSFLAKHKAEMEEFYRIPVPSWETTRTAIDKRLTYQLAEKEGIPIPRTHYPQNLEEAAALRVDFPALIKPAIRDNFYPLARKKAVRVNHRDELLREYAAAAQIIPLAQVMVQELIPGASENLYSFGSLFSDGEILGKVTAHRSRQHPPEFGRVTTLAETMHIPELEDISLRLLSAMKYQGISEVEFMWDPRDKKYKLIEMNARFWAWHSLAVAAGVDLPYLLHLMATGNPANAGDFETGIKWLRLIADVPATIRMLKGRKLSVRAYLQSWKGKRTFSVLSLDDPFPFIAEILMIPYIWKLRGL